MALFSAFNAKIEAHQHTKDAGSAQEIVEWLSRVNSDGEIVVDDKKPQELRFVSSITDIVIQPTDWIIRSQGARIFTLKNEIFSDVYSFIGDEAYNIKYANFMGIANSAGNSKSVLLPVKRYEELCMLLQNSRRYMSADFAKLGLVNLLFESVVFVKTNSLDEIKFVNTKEFLLIGLEEEA